MRKPKLVERFREYVESDERGVDIEVPEDANRVQKEAYVCKRMKVSRSKLYEMCIAVGIDTMYEELCRKSGRSTGKRRVKLPCAGCGGKFFSEEVTLVIEGEVPYYLCGACRASNVRVVVS